MKVIFTSSFSRITATVILGTVACCIMESKLPAAVNCSDPPAGLVGWWRAEGNANDSVAGNNGVMENVGFAAGKVSQAFAFDPQNFNPVRISIPDQPAFKLTSSLTIEGWVRPRGAGYCIFWRGDNRTGLDPYALSMQANNVLRFQIQDANNNVAFIDAPLAYDQWWHVAATLDGSSGAMKLYVNGALISQTNTVVRPMGDLDPSRDPALGIGNVGEHFNNFPFRGDIDEIALYSRALSSEEVQAIYNAGSSGKCFVQPVTPVCWSANGHCYEFVRADITWPDALAAAAGRNYQGLPGHLATITSAAENQFLTANFSTGVSSQFAWIAGREPADDGVWRWAAGPESGTQFSFWASPTAPFNYANWGGVEPNDNKSGEDYAMFNLGLVFNGIGNGQWADAIATPNYSDPVVGYLVEYEAAAPASNCVAAPSGLVSWWRAEKDALDTADGNHGTIASPSFATGQVGVAFDFIGNNNAVVADHPSLNPTNAITIECWVNARRLTTS
jgi:hypothetical protein